MIGDGTALENVTALAISGNFSLESFFGEGLNDMEDDVWEEFDDVDDMEGVKPRLPQIGIAHQAQMFKMPDDTKVEKITGILVDNNPLRAYWKTSFDESGGGDRPDCVANNAIHPNLDCVDKQSTSCLVCPKGRFSSNGDKPECQLKRRLHVLIPGSALPHRITLSPKNLEPFSMFMTEEVRGKRLKALGILIEFSLHPEKNKDGIEYSEIVMRVVKDTSTGKPIILAKDREQVKALKTFRLEWLDAMRGQEVLAEEQGHGGYDDNKDGEDAYDVASYGAQVSPEDDDNDSDPL